MKTETHTEIMTAEKPNLSELRNAWATRLIKAIDSFCKEADAESLFSSPEALHHAVVKLGMVNLLSSCTDLPGDLATVTQIIEAAFVDAVDVMEKHQRAKALH